MNFRAKSPLFFLMLISFLSLSAQNKSIELFVSANGNDTNDGSLNAPFKTINKAKDKDHGKVKGKAQLDFL